jgi:hypothetical protein
MPRSSRSSPQQSILHTANTAIEEQLDIHIRALEDQLNLDVVSFVGPITYGVDDYIREAVEDRNPRRPGLAVVLETEGGFIEVAQRIAETMRRHYQRVDFIVPNHAMSAGTVLVMSGDAIWMDYYSVLGPIDPQVPKPGGGGMIPALGYLIQYDRLIEKARKKQLNSAELTFLVSKFDPAELYRYEQARELSISLLKEWLVRYKFGKWTKTETRRKPVTKAMRTRRAAEVAKVLNNTDRWHSHGRGISMEVLRRDVRIKIDDFGKNAELNQKIRAYHKLLSDYMLRRNHIGILHALGRYVPFILGGW